MASVARSMDEIIAVGIGIFVLVLILALAFEGYAQTANQISNLYTASSGVYKNYTTYAGPLPNTFGSALQLAIFALVFIAVIVAIVYALRGRDNGNGGFLG